MGLALWMFHCAVYTALSNAQSQHVFLFSISLSHTFFTGHFSFKYVSSVSCREKCHYRPTEWKCCFTLLFIIALYHWPRHLWKKSIYYNIKDKIEAMLAGKLFSSSVFTTSPALLLLLQWLYFNLQSSKNLRPSFTSIRVKNIMNN